MTGRVVGYASLPVIPVVKGLKDALTTQLTPEASKAGKEAGKALGDGLTPGVVGAGKKAGSGFVTEFKSEVGRQFSTGNLVGFAAGGLALTAGASAIKDFVSTAVTAGSDLSESQSKVGVVFKQNAADIEKWSDTASTSMLISKQAALESSSTFGNLFQAFGMGADESAKMSKTLVQLSADLGSFNNIDPNIVLDKLRSGITGEQEAVKDLGIALTDQRLRQEAVNLGIYDGTGILSANQKVQASYALILKDTALAQGDVARTASGYANTLRAVQAATQDAYAEIGGAFLTSINGASSALGGPKGLVGLVSSLGSESAGAAANLGTIASTVTTIVSLFQSDLSKSDLWTFLTNPNGDKNEWNWQLKPGWLDSFAGGNIAEIQKTIQMVQDAQKAQALAESMLPSSHPYGDEAARLLYEAGHQSPWVPVVEEIGTTAVDAKSRVDQLLAALDELNGKNRSDAQSRLSLAETWSSLATLGDTQTIKGRTWKDKHGKTHHTDSRSVQLPFDPAISGGDFDLSTESGQKGLKFVTTISDDVESRVKAKIALGRTGAAERILDNNRRRLAGLLDEWGIDNSTAYARRFLGTPVELRSMADSDAAVRRHFTAPLPEGTPSTVQHIYEFSGPLQVESQADVPRLAAERVRLQRSSHGSVPHGAIQ